MILSCMTSDCNNQIFVVRPMFNGGERRLSWNERSREIRSPQEGFQVPVLCQSEIDCFMQKLVRM